MYHINIFEQVSSLNEARTRLILKSTLTSHACGVYIFSSNSFIKSMGTDIAFFIVIQLSISRMHAKMTCLSPVYLVNHQCKALNVTKEIGTSVLRMCNTSLLQWHHPKLHFSNYGYKRGCYGHWRTICSQNSAMLQFHNALGIRNRDACPILQ